MLSLLLFLKSCLCEERPAVDEETRRSKNTKAGRERLARLDRTRNTATG